MSATQIFPALDKATEAALRASIERFGVLVPVAIDQHGQILDGNNRARIAGELGVEYETRVHEVAGDAEAREIARTLNADRRHLTPEQRRQVVAALREEGHSSRAIAGALKVDHKTVLNDELSGGELSPPDRTTGLDGKSYPPRATPEAIAERRERAKSLRSEGHTREAIAQILGVSQSTIWTDLRANGKKKRQKVSPPTHYLPDLVAEDAARNLRTQTVRWCEQGRQVQVLLRDGVRLEVKSEEDRRSIKAELKLMAKLAEQLGREL